MRILIAGATGVLGRTMSQMFKERGHDVVGLARDEKARQTIERLGGQGVLASIFDSEAIASNVGRADVVIHAATAIPTKVGTGPGDWAMNDRLRRDGTAALTDAAAKLGAAAYIQQSVVWVARPADDSFFDETTEVRQPGALYRSAYDGERIAFDAGAKHGFDVTVLRCGGFYSAQAHHTRMLAEGLLKRRVPLIGGGRAVSANLHVHDAASAFVAAAEAPKTGLWHVTDDSPSTVAEMFDVLAEQLHAPSPWRIPLWMAKLFVWKEVVEFFTRSTRTSNRRFKRDFAWAAKFPSFREGLSDVAAAWRREGALVGGGEV